MVAQWARRQMGHKYATDDHQRFGDPLPLDRCCGDRPAGARNTWTVFSWTNPHGDDLFGALLFSILLFGGFETAAALAEETTNPRRNIPLALVGTVAAAAVLLVFCSYAGTIYFGPNHAAHSWGDALDGYAEMAGDVLGPWAALWIRLAVLVDFSATCIGFTLAASRGLFSLARDRQLPAIFAFTNRWGVPQQAANAVFAAALLIIAAGLLVPAKEIHNTLFVVSTAQALLLVLVYMGLALGALRLAMAMAGLSPGSGRSLPSPLWHLCALPGLPRALWPVWCFRGTGGGCFLAGWFAPAEGLNGVKGVDFCGPVCRGYAHGLLPTFHPEVKNTPIVVIIFTYIVFSTPVSGDFHHFSGA